MEHSFLMDSTGKETPPLHKNKKKRCGPKKKYVCCIKKKDGKFAKYQTSDLLAFTDWLDKKFEGWRWYNVYSNATGEQLGNFTKNRRPTRKTV